MTEATDRTSSIAKKIAGLLAKAESTTSEHERDSLLNKAAELQEKYIIDEATLRQAQGGPSVKIDYKMFCTERNTPLIKAKRELITGMALIFRGVALLGPGRAYIKVMAHEDDLAIIEAMYTSLLLQMQTAMSRDEAKARLTKAEIKGWRVSYAHAYVRTVYSRMEAARLAREKATSTGSALVLMDRTALVKKAVGQTSRAKGYANNANAHSGGKYAGYQAGQQADIGGQRVGSKAAPVALHA